MPKIEKEVIEKAFGDGGPVSKFDFSAHEETIKRLEDELEGIQKELFLYKDRTDKQVQESLQLTKQTRSDYILRMKELYDENNKAARETKDIVEMVKGKHQEAIAHLDRKQ
jgi:methyl coenzyme M reductase gamma subunit